MCTIKRGWDGCHSGLLSYLTGGLFFGECRGGGLCVIRAQMNWRSCNGSGRRRGQRLLSPPAPSCSSVPPSRSVDPSASSQRVVLGLDEGLGLAAVVHLDVDLGVRVALVSKALEVAAVAQQVDGQAEAQHADCQEAHVHLRGSTRSLGV